MLSSLLWLLLAVVAFFVSAMLISYALWYCENQKVLDLSRHIKENNTSILEKGMGKRAFSSFDLSASIQRSKGLAKSIVSGTVSGVQGIAKSGIVSSIATSTKKAMSGITSGIGSLIKPVQDKQVEQAPQLTQEQIQEKNYYEAVDKMIEEVAPVQEEPEVATIDYAKGTVRAGQSTQSEGQSDDTTMFEKLEFRILNRLKESGMENYDIWLELGALYKKFGQNDKAKDVFALVLKHASDKNKELARNELIGLS